MDRGWVDMLMNWAIFQLLKPLNVMRQKKYTQGIYQSMKMNIIDIPEFFFSFKDLQENSSIRKVVKGRCIHS